MKVYFSFALADSMFSGNVKIYRTEITPKEVKSYIEQGVESCCNKSHVATITALRTKHGIEAPIPETPPKVLLEKGDSLIVLGVRGLPRLIDRHEYTEEEIAKSEFGFSLYQVLFD